MIYIYNILIHKLDDSFVLLSMFSYCFMRINDDRTKRVPKKLLDDMDVIGRKRTKRFQKKKKIPTGLLNVSQTI